MTKRWAALLLCVLLAALEARAQPPPGEVVASVSDAKIVLTSGREVPLDGRVKVVQVSPAQRADVVPGAIVRWRGSSEGAEVVVLVEERGFGTWIVNAASPEGLQLDEVNGGRHLDLQLDDDTRFLRERRAMREDVTPGTRVMVDQRRDLTVIRILASGRGLQAQGERVPADLAEGAPYRQHSLDAADYAVTGFRWWWTPLVLVGALRLYAWLGARGWRQLRGVLTALAVIAAVDVVLLYPMPFNDALMAHPTRVWAMAPNLPAPDGGLATTDATGFRPSPAGDPARTILVLGDSSTFGIKTGSDRIYSWRLADLIAARSGRPAPRVENRAVPGYSTWQGLDVLRAQLRVGRPALVIVAFMANDWTWGQVPDSTFEPHGLVGTVQTALRRSQTYMALRHLVRRLAGASTLVPGRGPSVRVGPEEFAANLEAMRQMCVERGIPIVFVTLPLKPEMAAVSKPYREAVAVVAARPGASGLDLYEQWRRDGIADFHAGDPIHPDASGHQRIAEALVEHLAGRGLLP